MRRQLSVTALIVLSTCIFTVSLSAQQQPDGTLIVFGSTSETVLKAPALSGSPSFKNNGKYWGINGEVNAGKFSIWALYQTGQAETIPGGELFPPAPTFNPLTAERSDVIDVAIGWEVLKHRYTGDLDLYVGYYRLWAEPKISPANWYEGPQLGVKGRKQWSNGMAVTYKLGYVPTYTVNGYVQNSLRHDDIWLIRIGAEVPMTKKLFLTGGYGDMRLDAEATYDQSDAVVTFGGFFLGGGYKF